MPHSNHHHIHPWGIIMETPVCAKGWKPESPKKKAQPGIL